MVAPYFGMYLFPVNDFRKTVNYPTARSLGITPAHASLRFAPKANFLCRPLSTLPTSHQQLFLPSSRRPPWHSFFSSTCTSRLSTSSVALKRALALVLTRDASHQLNRSNPLFSFPDRLHPQPPPRLQHLDFRHSLRSQNQPKKQQQQRKCSHSARSATRTPARGCCRCCWPWPSA